MVGKDNKYVIEILFLKCLLLFVEELKILWKYEFKKNNKKVRCYGL